MEAHLFEEQFAKHELWPVFRVDDVPNRIKLVLRNWAVEYLDAGKSRECRKHTSTGLLHEEGWLWCTARIERPRRSDAFLGGQPEGRVKVVEKLGRMYGTCHSRV